VGLGARLFQLQVIERGRYAEQIRAQQMTRREIPAKRGSILDCHRRILAISRPIKSLAIDPSEVDDAQLTAERLAAALPSRRINAGDLRERLILKRKKRFLWIARQLTEEEVGSVDRLALASVFYVEESKREYPNGALMAHVLGFADIDGNGLEGVERTYDSDLKGTPGLAVYERTGTRSLLSTNRTRYIPPVEGNTVVLTIDAVIQRFVENELDDIVSTFNPVSASVVVIDPRNGHLLALANRPAFDPNLASTSKASQRRNRAISDFYEPGSVFKPFGVSGVLEERLSNINEQFFCENGRYRMGRRILRDHDPYGWLSLVDVIVYSSNIGTAKAVAQLGKERFHHYLRGFGFGSPTGIDLPGETSGLLRPVAQWNDVYSMGSISMGQEVATSPLQVAVAFAALANGGVLLKPRVVREVTDVGDPPRVIRDLSVSEPVCRVVRQNVALTMVDPILTGVVARGTGKPAKNVVGVKYILAGKTGTAQKIEEGGGYSHSKFISSFACIAPAKKPRMVILVMVNEPRSGPSYYGGTVAAPAAARIAVNSLGYLNVPTESESALLAQRTDSSY